MLNQSLGLFEIIVCDDASTDRTPQIIQSYAARFPKVIKPVFHQVNQGIAANFNSGLAATNGDYISVCAGDDFWHSEKIEKELTQLQQTPTAKWVYSKSAIYIHETGHTRPFQRKFDGATGDILFEVLTRQMSLRNWLAEASLVREAGWFDESLKCFEDWDYKIRLAKHAQAAYCPNMTVYYRRQRKQTASSDSIGNMSSKAQVQNKHRELLCQLEESQAAYIENVWQQDLVLSRPSARLARTLIRKLLKATGLSNVKSSD